MLLDRLNGLFLFPPVDDGKKDGSFFLGGANKVLPVVAPVAGVLFDANKPPTDVPVVSIFDFLVN